MTTTGNHTYGYSRIGQGRKYPLLPYSQLVWEMLQTDSEVYDYCATLKINASDISLENIKTAFEAALRAHAVFSMNVDRAGMQYLRYSDDIMHGQYHSVDIAESEGVIVVKIRLNRILGDGASMLLLMEDVVKALQSEPIDDDGYLDYLNWYEQYKQSEKYEQCKVWLEKHFSNMDYPVLPQTDKPLMANDMGQEGVLIEDYSDLYSEIQKLADDYLLTLTGFFSLCAALAIMDYNHTDSAALTWAYEGRDREEERRVFGSLHRDIPLRISKEEIDLTTSRGKEILFRQVRNEIRQGIAHSGYPFTLLKPQNEVWNYAVNVLHQPSAADLMKETPFQIEIEQGTETIAYSLLDVEIYEEDGLRVLYRYSAGHYNEGSMRYFAQLVRNNAEKLLMKN